jgi:hypothetical protein
MADITCDCAEELVLSPFPCKATDYGYPSKLILQAPGGDLTVAGEIPTLAEIQAGIAASGLDKLIVIEELTNGQRIESERQEESGADTADGLTNTLSINMAVVGKIKLLDESVRADLAKLNCNQRLKAWVITSQGYIFGGKKGYKVANFIPPTILEGFGVRAYHDINFVYQHNLNATDPAGQDDGFLSLTNVSGS